MPSPSDRSPDAETNWVIVFWSDDPTLDLSALKALVTVTYDDDGDAEDTEFMRAIGLTDFEPACIEAVAAPVRMPLQDLLAQASYAGQWLDELPDGAAASAALCLFSPNRAASPERAPMAVVGPIVFRLS